jgi:preprotein translocase subunit SecA
MERFKIPDDQPMEASILSRQIEGAQKKVEEQNFVARKNVLKYDDVMNTQRMVIYEQRRRVLDGEDLSGDIRDWIADVVQQNVAGFTDTDLVDEWDLDGLVAQMQALYGSDITVQELREEVEQTPDAITEEFTEDALDAYQEREQSFTPELMREIERFVILQVVDTRWREHLESMDYLREGVHLRAMAQKDPLVEYRAEGQAMFEELGGVIREEVVLTLYHAQIQVEPQQLEPQQGNGNLVYEHETAAGADAISAAGSAAGSVGTSFAAQGGGTATATAVNDHKDIGRNDPCWCGSGKKFKKCHGA